MIQTQYFTFEKVKDRGPRIFFPVRNDILAEIYDVSFARDLKINGLIKAPDFRICFYNQQDRIAYQPGIYKIHPIGMIPKKTNFLMETTLFQQERRGCLIDNTGYTNA
jgi:hypothetical protein